MCPSGACWVAWFGGGVVSECEVCAGQEYNGWPNRETWAVGLHLDNDYGLYQHRRGLVDVMVA